MHKVEGFEVDELYSLIHETELQQIVTDETLSLLLETHDLEIETDDDIVCLHEGRCELEYEGDSH